MVGRNYKWLDKEMLTPKQLKLLKFLIEYKKEKQYMPSFKEMKVYMNVKSNSVVYHMLGYIEWKGYIKRYPAHARAITILREAA